MRYFVVSDINCINKALRTWSIDGKTLKALSGWNQIPNNSSSSLQKCMLRGHFPNCLIPCQSSSSFPPKTVERTRPDSPPAVSVSVLVDFGLNVLRWIINKQRRRFTPAYKPQFVCFFRIIHHRVHFSLDFTQTWCFSGSI